uniref:Microsomal glutathione S-transferase 1 n=1 Tax=Globisporangium ultimum (strain ATCC 200006 / CBS 805.95 / DAOM BR144) TaxID=431595 RepID=K3WEJ4_GLOUD
MVGVNVKVFVTYAAVLYLKFLATIAVQSRKTFCAGGRPPEDNKLHMAKRFPGVKQNYGTSATDAPPSDQLLLVRHVELRWRRIVSNDLESIPLALFVFAGGILAESNDQVHSVAMVVYTFARVAHTFAYAKSIQPQRSMLWFAGVLSTIVGVANAVVAIL